MILLTLVLLGVTAIIVGSVQESTNVNPNLKNILRCSGYIIIFFNSIFIMSGMDPTIVAILFLIINLIFFGIVFYYRGI